MKNLLLIVAVAVFAIAGAAQKEQPKKTDARKTTAVKKTPTPAKKTTTAAKKPADIKTPAASTKKAANTSSAPKKAIVDSPKATASNSATKTTPKPPVKKDPKAELDKALALEKPEEKIAALTKFLSAFPTSELRPRAFESLTAARVAVGEAKFEAGEREAALTLFRAAIKDAPVPYPEKLFNEVISKMPPNLYFRGETATALETAAVIEANSATSFPQLIMLAGFHLLTENGSEAKRLAEAAIMIDERSSAAYQVIGMANRLNFDLDASAAAYEKALEFDPESVPARRGLADMKRALSKPDEALALYDALIANDAEDQLSQTGRILSLFDAGKRTEAEAELARAIEANPSNVPLIAGAAYWHAANGSSTKAIDLAGKAISVEPRFIWSHIALARALLAEGRFSDAEQVLLKARQFGNFPTLEYETALARLAGGFYREAVEELQKSFSVKDGMVTTKLGRRIERSEKSFTELLANERRASILAPRSADKKEVSETLKALFEFKLLLAEASPDPVKAAELADAFAMGSDKMRFHRQVYAANELLEKNIAPAKAFELSRAAVTSVDDGLNVALPAAPIMASELYASRKESIAADRYILVPDVPKQTLSAIARGRIEEIAGWALLQQESNPEAAVRLRRAVGILPEKSVWWRSSTWRLGLALEAHGKDKEALDAFVKNYQSAEPEPSKYAAIEAVYKRVNGSTEGLDALIGANPAKLAETPVEAKAPETIETKAPENEAKEAKEETKELPSKTFETKASTDEKPTGKASETKSEEKKESTPATVEAKLATDEKVTNEKQQPSENKPPETKTAENEKTDETKAAENKETDKPLFEPVIIEITKSEPVRPKKDPEPVTEQSVSSATSGEKPSARPRVVEDKEVKTDSDKPCTINISQENISLIGGGGSVGILAGVEGVDAKEITAGSSSEKDVEITRDPDLTGGSSRALFVIRSLTPAVGVYQVTFTAPCGKREVVVKIR